MERASSALIHEEPGAHRRRRSTPCRETSTATDPDIRSCCLGAVPAHFAAAGVPNWEGRIGLAIEDRLRGVRAELNARRVRRAGAIELDDWEPDQGRTAVERLLTSGAQPRALICANDRVAIGAYQALLEHSLRVPYDVSIVSFDDSELAQVVRPGLTSIALPHEEMGRLAIELLLESGSAPGRHMVPMVLIERDSTNRE